jgi:hypothetical protein
MEIAEKLQRGTPAASIDVTPAMEEVIKVLHRCRRFLKESRDAVRESASGGGTSRARCRAGSSSAVVSVSDVARCDR